MSIAAMLLSVILAAGEQPAGDVPSRSQVQLSQTVDATVLDEIVVEGRQLDVYVRDFVNQVAAPARDRGLARWRGSVCVGAANMRTDVAQAFVDRVSDVAVDVGLTAGEPGCRPNIVIVAAEDGAAMAERLVETQPTIFRLGTSTADLGAAALRRFQGDSRPIRWWMTSIPIDDTTNVAAVTLPQQRRSSAGKMSAPSGSGTLDSPINYATLTRKMASRLISSVRDDILRVVVIIDTEAFDRANVGQIADYAAMVSLAQIDPEAEVAGYHSILGLFSDDQPSPAMTDWDMTYLHALYSTHPPRVNRGSQVSAVVDQVVDYRREAAQRF
ncbi:hypothetical protein [Brevundimonas sp.]|uniref:hypothetical protein n=1 Tax=Brevundimonas sp. TaxID=1871086 RepID=UPI0035B3E367